MQRIVLTLAVIVLVLAALGAGVLAAHWPFWQRAWQWHAATTGWPAVIKGATRVLHGGTHAQALDFQSDAGIASVAASVTTHALLRADRDGRVAAWFAPGYEPRSLMDGRGLTAMVLVPLFAQLTGEHPQLLDSPAGAWLPEWSKEDRRGVITPRQLFWQLSGMPAGVFDPLDPFSARAQLASGPDFARAALRWQPGWPPGSHFEAAPVNAQLLALVAASAGGMPFADMLQQRLWSQVAADDAEAMLDHRDGDAAAHCCLRASLADWLRLALVVANDGRHGGTALWPPGFAAQLATASPVHAGYGLGFQLQAEPGRQLLGATSAGREVLIDTATGAALLWVGDGEPPAGLDLLLRTHNAEDHRPVPVP